MLHFIYALVDPRTDVVAYIGITNNPNARLIEHLEGKSPNDDKDAWIWELQEEGYEPRMKILEVVDTRKEALSRERYWIQHYLSAGVPLTNLVNCRPNVHRREPIRRPKVKTNWRRIKDQAPEGYYTAEQARELLSPYGTRLQDHERLGIRRIFSEEEQVYYYFKSDVDSAADELHDFYTKYPGFKLRK